MFWKFWQCGDLPLAAEVKRGAPWKFLLQLQKTGGLL
jgi:hypothetical protein